MRYTIKGLTDRTITINSLRVTIRGNSKNVALYPHSIAYHIDVGAEGQWDELNAMIKAGYLAVLPEEEKIAKTAKIVAAKTPVKTVVAKKAKKESKSVKKAATKAADKKATVPPAKPIKAGSAKRIRKLSPAQELLEGTIVVNADGIVQKGRMTKSSDIDLTESETTRASMEAAKKMEKEERLAAIEQEIDETRLDISERMGNDVVVAGGGTAKQKRNAKHKILKSAVPSAKTNWIDLETEETDKEEYTDAFIDPSAPIADANDPFIE